jgi:hypothetical protein
MTVSGHLSTTLFGKWGKIPSMSVKISMINRSFDGRFTLNQLVVGFDIFSDYRGRKSSFFPTCD